MLLIELLKKERASEIYDILVSIGGANESERDSFIRHHCVEGCAEWRFQGNFGFGGKYRSISNMITMYPEDETPKRLELKIKIDELLRR